MDLLVLQFNQCFVMFYFKMEIQIDEHGNNDSFSGEKTKVLYFVPSLLFFPLGWLNVEADHILAGALKLTVNCAISFLDILHTYSGVLAIGKAFLRCKMTTFAMKATTCMLCPSQGVLKLKDLYL